MSTPAFVYRVVALREGNTRPRVTEFKSLRAARRRFALLTSPEPWRAYGHDPESKMCCGGGNCGCGGLTVRESYMEKRARLPKLVYARIDRRKVSEWEPLEPQIGEVQP